MTQYMARFTKTLDSRHKVPMTTRTYMWVEPLALEHEAWLVHNYGTRY